MSQSDQESVYDDDEIEDFSGEVDDILWGDDDELFNPDELKAFKEKAQNEAKNPELTPEIKAQVAEHFGQTKHGGSSAGTSRLMEELAYFYKQGLCDHQQTPVGEQIKDEFELVDEDLYHWIIRLRDFPRTQNDTPDERRLWNDLQKLDKKQQFVELEILFPKDYPFAPPFIRVVRPRFQFHTGHVTIGGSICKEVLTRSGWIPTMSLENLMMDIKAEMVSGGAQIDFGNLRPYSVSEAREAFNRVARDHNWKV